ATLTVADTEVNHAPTNATLTVALPGIGLGVSNALAFPIVLPDLAYYGYATTPAGGTATTSTPSGGGTLTNSKDDDSKSPATYLSWANSPTKIDKGLQPSDEALLSVQSITLMAVTPVTPDEVTGSEVLGAGSGATLAAVFSYPATVTGAAESALALHYYDGGVWKPVRGGGGAAPQVDTANQTGPGGVAWGGVVTVTLDNTSIPRLTDLAGTRFFRIVTDDSPPTVSAQVSGPQGLNGWHTGDVTVIWTVADLDSLVSLGSGCANALLTRDTDSNGVTITCTATSAGGSASQSVTIKRDTAAPLPLAAGAVGIEGYTAGQWTNQDVAVSFVCEDRGAGLAGACPAAQTVTAEGVTEATTGEVCDLAGNCGSASFTVRIDRTPPTVTTPPSVLVSTASGTALVTYPATALDVASGVTGALTCVPASGGEFPLGTTTVTCTATDRAGNTGGASFPVTVTPSFGLTFNNVPDAVTAEPASSAGAAVAYTAPTVTDVIGVSWPVTCDPASGTTFAIGIATVTCTTSDVFGHTAAASFTVTVVVTGAPVLSGTPAAKLVEAIGPLGAPVTYTAPTAVSSLGMTLPVVCTPASGATFPLGVTTVACTAADSYGNQSVETFDVTVSDTTAPTVSVPANLAVNVMGTSAVATYGAATATDAVGVVGGVVCAPASGAGFPLGVTTVTCSAHDAAGATGSATFTVTVVNATPPSFQNVPINLTIEATGPQGATATYTAPTATDNHGNSVTVACAPVSGAAFAIQATTVTCTATAAGGLHATAAFTVTVRDTTPPTLTLPAPVTTAATSAAGAPVSFTATAADLVDGA
ncbi:MAG: HYR domain-containing protein, partial [Chloroflexi bacterium]|nr:HYR domain-containing protein [Chloroflexota bacterium]